MLNVTVLYPNSKEAKFDLEYYSASHVPMVKARFGARCKRVEVNVGLNDPATGSAPAYIAIFNMYFDSVEDFQAAFGPHAEEIMGDIKNYTDVQAIIQFNEVRD